MDEARVKRFDGIEDHAEALGFGDFNFMQDLVDYPHGLSDAEVAKRCGWALAHLEEFRSYWYDPTMSEIRRYALAIGVDVEHTMWEVEIG